MFRRKNRNNTGPIINGDSDIYPITRFSYLSYTLALCCILMLMSSVGIRAADKFNYGVMSSMIRLLTVAGFPCPVRRG